MTEIDCDIAHAEQVLMGVWNSPRWIYERRGNELFRRMVLNPPLKEQFNAPTQFIGYADPPSEKVGKDKDYILTERYR